MTGASIPPWNGQRPRASHVPYITAVRRRLHARDIHTTVLDTADDGARRTAALMLHPVQDAFPAPVAQETVLSWDESNGWSLTFPAPVGQAPGRPSREGLRVLPGPDDVAVWAVVLLTCTDLATSRDRPPFRDHAVYDPEFEWGLARYHRP